MIKILNEQLYKVNELSNKKSLLLKFKNKNINTIGDLLLHIPRKFINVYKFNYEIQKEFKLDNEEDKHFLLKGLIISKSFIRSKNGATLYKYHLELLYSKKIDLLFFFKPGYDKFIGKEVLIFGQLESDTNQIIHPIIIDKFKFLNDLTWKTIKENDLLPIYPSIKDVSAIELRRTIQLLLSMITNSTELKKYPIEWDGYPDIKDTLTTIHGLCKLNNTYNYIESNEFKLSIKKLGLDEYLAFNKRLKDTFLYRPSNFQKITNILNSTDIKDLFKKNVIENTKNIVLAINKFYKSLPFKLRDEQIDIIINLIKKMQLDIPMNALLIGDVGTGKTVISMFLALYNVLQGFKVLVITPSVLLAHQHYNNFTEYFSHTNIKIKLTTGKIKLKDSDLIDTDIIISTQTAFYKKEYIENLGLVIIDEQQRFGVKQRDLIIQSLSNNYPHQLMMSATPIPRTLHILKFFPENIFRLKGKNNVNSLRSTHLIPQTKLENLLNRLTEISLTNKLDKSKIYWICSRIEENDKASVTSRLNSLISNNKLDIFKKISLHSKMSENEKIEALKTFREENNIIMVCTTAIEVGIDIDDANILIIEDPEQFGIAQLHQLRGRIGRKGQKAYCIIITPEIINDNLKQRLLVFKQYNDGEEIANWDLKLRGYGEVFSLKQTGLSGTLSFFRGFIDKDEEELFRYKLKNINNLLCNNDDINLFLKIWEIY